MKAAAVLLVLLLNLPFATARAQVDSREGLALQNQILELRHEVQMLRDELARSGGGGTSLGGYQPAPAALAPAGSDLSAQLLERVQRLEEQVRAMRGRIDEVDNARQRQGEELSKKLGDLNFKIETGGGGAGAATAAGPLASDGTRQPTMSPPPAMLDAQSGAPPPPPVHRTPEMILQEGNAALARKDFAAAAASAQEVLAAGKGPKLTDAQFLKAQALMGQRDFSNAAIAYDDTYNRSRTGIHAQDSLLGLAQALIGIPEKKAACETLDKLRAEFPTPRGDLREPIAQARKTAGCK